MRHKSHALLIDAIGKQTLRTQFGAELGGREAEAGNIKDDDIGLNGSGVNRNAWNLSNCFAKIACVFVVAGQKRG